LNLRRLGLYLVFDVILFEGFQSPHCETSREHLLIEFVVVLTSQVSIPLEVADGVFNRPVRTPRTRIGPYLPEVLMKDLCFSF
jgi:hypothetical protein